MELIEQIDCMRPSEESSSAEASLARPQSILAALNRLPELISSSVTTTVATGFAAFGVTAIQGIILARLLGPEARGEFGTAVFFTYTLSAMGLMGAQFAVARRAASDPSGRLQLSQSVLRLGVLTGLGTMLVVTLLAFTTLPLQKQYLAPLCVVCALAQPLEHMRLLLLAVDQGSAAFRRYNIVVLATSTVLPISLLVMWAIGMMSMVTAAILTLLAPVVGLTLRLALSDTRLSWTDSPSPRPLTLLKEGCPYWVSSAVCDLYTRLDQFLVLWVGSFVIQGQYAAAVPAAGIMLVGADALALFSFNAGSRTHQPMSPRQLLRKGSFVAAFQALMAACYALVVGPLIVFLYGSDFAGAVPFALALIPGQAIHGVARVLEGHLRGRGKVKVGIWARVVAAVSMITIVMLTFNRLHALSIPLAAGLGHAVVAATLAWVAFADIRRQAKASELPQPGEALL